MENMDPEKLLIYERRIPERKGIYVPYPEELAPEICSYLQQKGIGQLYIHQAEAFRRMREGEHVVITTATASGKTLSFLLPVLQTILEDPSARAIFIYPTKALAADQFRVMQEAIAGIGGDRISAGVYDGDTLPAERTRIRRSANIILTNPEMMNSAFLPNHSKYGFDLIFSNLKYVVTDELHSYRGAFGAHMANIFRRLERVCRYYHADPQFMCSSATIANPLELAETICGQKFTLIDRDGSPAPAKNYRILQPPEIKGTDDLICGRIPAQTVAAEILPRLAEEERHFIAFARTRRGVEVILKEARDKMDAAGFLGKASGQRISGYRGGYTPLERKTIEEGMISGKLLGLVSTNALELGIDIGELDTTVLAGFPGRRASFWQQTGRAGRGRQEADNYLILENNPFDQYIAVDPDWLFEQGSEHAIVDPDNLLIELAHVRAAAAEMPLTLADISLFKDLGEILPVLLQAAEVKALSGRFLWSGPAFPAGDYSLRNMDKSRYKMICDGKTVTEMDESQAFHELYPGAVYLHEGNLYEIRKLDLVSRTAEGKPFTGDYYTVPAGETDTRIINLRQEKDLGRTGIHFGDININDIVMMFKKLQFHNHQNLGYVDLTLPLQKDYDTEGTWIHIPENVVQTYRRMLVKSSSGQRVLGNHFEGMAHAIQSAAMMVTMTSREDIGTVVSGNALIPDEDTEENVSMFIYDRYAGGLGYAEKIYDLMPEILDKAIRLVRGCSCKDGCPACVGDYTLDRKLVLWGLENLYEESAAPESDKIVRWPRQTEVRRQFSFFRLDTFRNGSQWWDFCKAAEENGDQMGSFLKTISKVQVEGHRMTLFVSGAFLKSWLLETENMKNLKNVLRFHCICPQDMKILVKTKEDSEEEKLAVVNKNQKLRRRYEEFLSSDRSDAE